MSFVNLTEALSPYVLGIYRVGTSDSLSSFWSWMEITELFVDPVNNFDDCIGHVS